MFHNRTTSFRWLNQQHVFVNIQVRIESLNAVLNVRETQRTLEMRRGLNVSGLVRILRLEYHVWDHHVQNFEVSNDSHEVLQLSQMVQLIALIETS